MRHGIKDGEADKPFNRPTRRGQRVNYDVAAGLQYNGRNLPSGMMWRWVRHPPSLLASKARHRWRQGVEPQQSSVPLFPALHTGEGLFSLLERADFFKAPSTQATEAHIWAFSRVRIFSASCPPCVFHFVRLIQRLISDLWYHSPPPPLSLCSFSLCHYKWNPFPAIYNSICCCDSALCLQMFKVSFVKFFFFFFLFLPLASPAWWKVIILNPLLNMSLWSSENLIGDKGSRRTSP